MKNDDEPQRGGHHRARGGHTGNSEPDAKQGTPSRRGNNNRRRGRGGHRGNKNAHHDLVEPRGPPVGGPLPGMMHPNYPVSSPIYYDPPPMDLSYPPAPMLQHMDDSHDQYANRPVMHNRIYYPPQYVYPVGIHGEVPNYMSPPNQAQFNRFANEFVPSPIPAMSRSPSTIATSKSLNPDRPHYHETLKQPPARPTTKPSVSPKANAPPGGYRPHVKNASYRNMQYFLLQLLGSPPPTIDCIKAIHDSKAFPMTTNVTTFTLDRDLSQEEIVSYGDVIDATICPSRDLASRPSQMQMIEAVTQFLKRANYMDLSKSPFTPKLNASKPSNILNIQLNARAPKCYEWDSLDNPVQQHHNILTIGSRVVVVMIPFISLDKINTLIRMSDELSKAKHDGQKRSSFGKTPKLTFFKQNAHRMFPMENVYVWKSTRTCPFLSTLFHVHIPSTAKVTNRPTGGHTPIGSPVTRFHARTEMLVGNAKNLGNAVRDVMATAKGLPLTPYFLGPGIQEEQGFLVPNRPGEAELLIANADQDYVFLRRKSRKYGSRDSSYMILGPRLVHEWIENRRFVLEEPLTPRDCIAIDCEMLEITGGVEALGRVAITDSDGKTLLDECVKAPGKITNYRTEFSGLTPQMIENASLSLFDIQMELVNIFRERNKRLILVGHSLESDLSALGIMYPFILDSSLLYPHIRGGPMKCSLKMCAKMVLGIDMQDENDDGANGHDPVEDALASWALCIDKVFKLTHHSTDNDLDLKETDTMPQWMSMSSSLAYTLPPISRRNASADGAEEEAFPLLGDEVAPFVRSASQSMTMAGSTTPTLPRFQGGWRGGISVYDDWPIPANTIDCSQFFNSTLFAPHVIDPAQSYLRTSHKQVEEAVKYLTGQRGCEPTDHPFSCKPIGSTADESLTSRLTVIMVRDYQRLCCHTLGSLRSLVHEGLPRWDAEGLSKKGRHSGLFYGGGYNSRARRLVHSGLDKHELNCVKSEQPIEQHEGMLRNKKGEITETEQQITEHCAASSTEKMFPQVNPSEELLTLATMDGYLERLYKSLDKGDVLYVVSGSGDTARYFNLESFTKFQREHYPNNPTLGQLEAELAAATKDFRSPFGMTLVRQ